MLKSLPILVIALMLVSCGQSDKVRITGTIENAAGRTLYLEEVGVGRTNITDSLELNIKGGFSFRTQELAYPAFYNLKISGQNFTTLLVHPGEKLVFQADASDLLGTAEISGSKESESLIALNRHLRETIKNIVDVIENSSDLVTEEEIDKEIDSLLGVQRNYSISFILENLESLASITALYQKYDDETWVLDELRDLQYLKIASESLSKKWPGSPHVKALARDTEEKLRDYEYARFLSASSDKTQIRNFPDLALPSQQGDTLSLSSLKARYVLLIFSASWNPSSTDHDVSFKPVFDSYKNKGFDIYQVGLERNPQEWLRYTTFNELNWNHVSELDAETSMAAGMYNVQSLPANFLIDRETGILARNITARELQNRLSSLLR
jgi:peroxiredoxin